jgi:hypothetical protein
VDLSGHRKAIYGQKELEKIVNSTAQSQAYMPLDEVVVLFVVPEQHGSAMMRNT